MSTRGQRFLKISMPAPAPSDSPVVGATVEILPPGYSRSSKWPWIGIALAAVGGFALHDRIKGTHAFRGARKDARKAKTIARREYGRLASKFGG